MASIGGLDVAFGAQMQLVRTNVLCLCADTNDYTSADLQKVYNLAVQRFPHALKPDYIYAYNSGASPEDVTATALASNITDDVEGGLLKSISTVPIAGGNGYGANSSNEYRGLSIEAILNVGAFEIESGTSSSAEDLFESSVGGSPVALTDNFSSASTLQSTLMAAIMNDAESGYNTQPVVSTLDLSAVLGDLTFQGTVTDTEIDSLTDANEGSSGSTLANLKTQLNQGAAVISVLSLCKVA